MLFNGCQQKICLSPWLSVMILNMGTDKPQILLTLSEDLLKRIEKYQKDKNFFSRSEAVRQLIQESLSQYEKKKKWGSYEETGCYKVTLPVDNLNVKRTLSNSRLWQEIITFN